MKILTLARDLKRRRGREREGAFVAEGVRAVEALIASSLSVRGILVAPQLSGAQRGAALLAELARRELPVTHVDESDFASAAETDSPQGVLALAEIPSRELSRVPHPDPARYLVLDAVQDPGNVGTIVRTAAALGATATLALPGTVDFWNAKVVRAAMGALFHHPTASCTSEELSTFLDQHGIELWATDAAGDSLSSRSAPDRLALAVGNEGSGISPAMRTLARHCVALPTAAPVESLNVAVASGIILYHLRA
ncbi:MAG: RNA methyltransferase [Gemmatimonadaceae bacterium]